MDQQVATPDVSAPPSSAQQSEALPDFRSFRESENRAAIARQTGKPEPGKPAAPAASKPEASSAEGKEPEEKAAPASEAGKKPSQEPKRTTAVDRKAELNAEIRDLLKQRDALRAEVSGKPDVKPESSPAPAKPKAEASKALEAPKKPQLSDFSGDDAWQKYEEARDKYYEDLADYKAAKRLDDYVQRQREEATRRELLTSVESAKGRYGPESEAAIAQAADVLASDEIPVEVRRVINDSDVMIDLLYVAAKDPAELDAFVSLAKSNPLAAVKKIAVMEHLIRQELAQGGKSGQEPTERAMPERGEDGKFVSSKPPEKPQTKAPAIGTEVSGRGSAPPDPTEQAVKTGDFRKFREVENAKLMERYRGR